MVATKNAYFIPCGLGLLAIFAGLLFYPYSRVTMDDESVALGKLVEIPLQSITATGRSSTVAFEIPNNKQWTHIRNKWGQPRYIIAIDSDPMGMKHETISLNDVGIRIELSKAEAPVELKPGSPPYSYSSNAHDCCLDFWANPGDKLELSVTPVRRPFQPPLGAQLFIINAWPNTKDLLVGDDLSNDLYPISRFLIRLGVVLLIIAILLRLCVGKGTKSKPRSHAVGPWHGIF